MLKLIEDNALPRLPTNDRKMPLAHHAVHQVVAEDKDNLLRLDLEEREILSILMRLCKIN
jgi:hypothetical protein